VRIVASIEEPTAIRAILAHFEQHGALEKKHTTDQQRAPTGGGVTSRRPRRLSQAQSKSPGRNGHPIGCGHDPAGLRSARCRESESHWHGRRR
jgi:hypothetical protein